MPEVLQNADIRIEEVVNPTDDVVEAIGWLSRPLRSVKQEPSADAIRRMAESPSVQLLIALNRENQIIGMMTLCVYETPHGVRAWLEDTSVTRSGKGVGRLLTEEALRRARAAGSTECHLLVDPTQTGGMKMAALMGFGTPEQDMLRIAL